MRLQMYDLRKENAEIETGVREEVSAEMADLLAVMEAQFQAKLEAHKAKAAAAIAGAAPEAALAPSACCAAPRWGAAGSTVLDPGFEQLTPRLLSTLET